LEREERKSQYKFKDSITYEEKYHEDMVSASIEEKKIPADGERVINRG